MICSAVKKNIISGLAGNTTYSSSYNYVDTVLGITSGSNSNLAYVALLYNSPTENSDGFYNLTDKEPIPGTEETANGYARYKFVPTVLKLNGSWVALNSNTVYFEEALLDWHCGDLTKIKYFALSTSSTTGSAGYAYGEILDAAGNPTEIEVKKEQLPIIRKQQLRLSITEQEQTKYRITLASGNNTPEGAVFDPKNTLSSGAAYYYMPALNNAELTGVSGYVFAGWYYDAACTDSPVTLPESGTYGDKLTADTTVYAKFVQAE